MFTMLNSYLIITDKIVFSIIVSNFLYPLSVSKFHRQTPISVAKKQEIINQRHYKEKISNSLQVEGIQ